MKSLAFVRALIGMSCVLGLSAVPMPAQAVAQTKDSAKPDAKLKTQPSTGKSGVIFRCDFDAHPAGPYRMEDFRKDWNKPRGGGGIAEGRATLVEGSEAYKGRSLRVLYPKGAVGPMDAGAQWRLTFDRGYNELYLAYRVKFDKDFNFVKGGKIPGLVGGKANSGGHPPDGTDGWSARMMWGRDGRVVQYVYHPDQKGKYGESLHYDIGGRRQFKPGVWHAVEHRIVMNTPGKHDGVIQAWFDGTLALDKRDLRFRDVDTFAIDQFAFSTFFGGDNATWAPVKDEAIYFDDFVISTEPIRLGE